MTNVWPRSAPRRSRALGWLVGLALASSVPELVAADVTPADIVFEQGRQLMAEGRVADACAKFEESHRIEPAAGTLLNLAVCNEARGRTATAWAQFGTAEAAAELDGRPDRLALARKHRAALAIELAYLTLVIPAAQRTEGLEVQLDGVAVPPAGWNVAVPIDPGAHLVLARAPGAGQQSFAVEIKAKDVASVVIELGSSDAPSAERAAPTSEEMQRSAAEQARSSRLRTVAYVSGGLGVAALGAGVYFGARAFSEWDQRNDLCPLDSCVTEAGKEAQRSAETAARNANIAVGVGIVGLVAGVALYFLGAEPEREPPSVGWSLAPRVAREQLGIIAERHW